jgi:hypothetical protein
MIHITDNHDALLDYLYEEGDSTERFKIAKHLQECAACSVAVLEFQSVRGMLRDWTPPASELGFRMVKDGDAALSLSAPVNHGARGGWWQGSRVLFQAAAAVVLFAAGMTVSQVNVRYANGEMTLSWGEVAPTPTSRGSIVLPPQPASSTPLDPLDRNEMERIIREQLARYASSGDTEQLLQRVRTMIDQSEQRQQSVLALRLSQVAREVDTQHKADILNIQQDFGRQQEATIDYLVRTSGGVK